MHAILNFYVFLWKNKTVFFFFMTLIPLVSFFYLQNNSHKLEAIIEVSNYDLADFKNDYTDYKKAKIIVKDNTIKTSIIAENLSLSKKILKDLNQEIQADISYSVLKKLKQDLKTHSLKVASLLEKKRAFAKLKKQGKLTEVEQQVYNDEFKIVDDLYKQELKAFQQADVNFKSYSLDKNTKIIYLEPQGNQIIGRFSLSILLAFLIAVLASAIRSFFNNSFDDELDIKRATNIKAMEGFPKFKKLEFANNILMANKLKVHSLTEISRIFKYISARDRKVFSVISSIKNEGNSSLVYSLAQHAAENDNKVLLLDMNLKNMELSIKLTKTIENWDVTSKNFDSLDEKTVSLTKNLDFLPALKDAKSLELLKTSKGLKALIKHLKTKYDYIFIDTTAVFSVNINNIDSVILAEAVDGVLVNYLANKTSKRILLETIDKINMSESNILGVVTNNRYNPKLKDELLMFCSYLEKINKGMADNLRLRILKSYLLDEE